MCASIFSRIITGELPSDTVYEDDSVVAFRDIAPQAPVHVLIVPREEIISIDELKPEHEALVGHMVLTAQMLAQRLGLQAGYRLVMNCGDHGGQTVPHLHLHLLGGRAMHWPPG